MRPSPSLRPALAALALAAAAAPAAAQEDGPGAVARRAMAQEIATAALAEGDAVLALAAARLALAVPLNDAARTPERAADPPEGAPPGPPSARDLLAAARALAGEDVTLAGLVDEAEAEATAPPAAAAAASRSALAPGASEVWPVALFGGAASEVAVLSGAPLTLSVADAEGRVLCAPGAPAPVALCRILPEDNATFAVTVTNPGPGPAAYLLLTD